MGHVRQELGLVLGGHGELHCLLFQALSRDLDLAVLELDVPVLVFEESCLLLELSVRLPELLLPPLQLLRLVLELLGESQGLGEQLLGTHVGDHAV